MPADPTPPPVPALPLDELMELATPLLREAFDEMPPEQAAVTELGRRIRAEVARIYAAGRSEAAADLPSTTAEIGAWLSRHGLSTTPGVGPVLAAVRADLTAEGNRTDE